MTEMCECPLCNSKDAQSIESDYVYGGKETQIYVHCDNCDLYYLFPKPTLKELDTFYSEQFEEFMQNRSGDDSNWEDAQKHCEISQRDALRRMAFLDDTLQNAHNILEVGASTGFMVDAVQTKYQDKHIYAVEPSLRFCEYMQKKGIKAYSALESVPDIKFDLIMHFFVVAHVYDFEEFLTEQYKRLNKGGKIIFETPSTTDPLRSLYKVKDFQNFYWQVAHLVSFSPLSMKYLLDKLGYTYNIIPHQRYDISNHMVWMQEGKPGGRGKYSHVFSEELETEYKKSLETHWLCDTLIVEIIKK